MKKTSIVMWVLSLGLMLSFCSSLSAEVIVLKNGETLGGDIIKNSDGSYKMEGDLIKVDWKGEILTFPLWDIDSIDGMPPEIPAWLAWKKNIDGYTNNVDIIFGKCLSVATDIIAFVTVSEEKNDYQGLKETITEKGEEIQTLVLKELDDLAIPEGLGDYHKKVKESCMSLAIIGREILTKDRKFIIEAYLRAIELRKESVEMIKKAFADYGVPALYNEQVDSALERLKEKISYIQAVSEYDKAVKLAAEGSLGEAEAEFKNVLEKEKFIEIVNSSLAIIEDFYNGKISRDYAVLLFKSKDYIKERKFEEAIKALEESIRLYPDYDYQLYVVLANLYIITEQDMEAVRCLQTAMEINPEYIKGYFIIGVLYHNLGYVQKAKENLYKALDLFKEKGEGEIVNNIEEYMGQFGYLDAGALQDNSPEDNISGKPAKAVDHEEYIFYVPGMLERDKKYPLLITLSPNGEAESMMQIWKNIAESKKWFIYSSKAYRNCPNVLLILSQLAEHLEELSSDYPVDESKIIASGVSGGGMGAHILAYKYPSLISAVVVNTGMINEILRAEEKTYPNDKIAVFLASPTDFRYKEMEDNRDFLEKHGWTIKWIEFLGGHVVAPDNVYKEAADWIEEEFRNRDAE